MPTPAEANQEASKLDLLAEICALSVTEFIEEYALEDVVRGICMNPHCDFTADYEPGTLETCNPEKPF